MNKNVLLLDTNISAKPIYDFLHKTGCKLYVAGGNPNDALAKSAQHYINIDYSNINDVEALVEKLSIDFLVPGGNDLSYQVCADINERHNFYNIDPLETNQIINNKEWFKRFSTKIGLHVPNKRDNYMLGSYPTPIIVKPVDAYSGHGITVLRHPNEDNLENAISLARECSNSNTYLIEEFIEGQLYSHSAFIVDGDIINDFVVEEFCVVNQYAVDTSRVLFDFNPLILKKLRNDIMKLAKELKLQDGLIHTQFIYNGDSFWIIEITRRCPGDLYSLLIELSTGFPYAEYYAKPFLNIKNKKRDTYEFKENVFRHTLTLSDSTYSYGVSFNRPVKNMKYFSLSLTGDYVKQSPFGRIGILFGQAEEKKEFDDIYNCALNRTLYNID